MPITIPLISAMYRTRLDHPLLEMGSNIVNIYKENANIGIVIETSIKSSYGEGGGENSPNFQRLSWWHTCEAVTPIHARKVMSTGYYVDIRLNYVAC